MQCYGFNSTHNNEAQAEQEEEEKITEHYDSVHGMNFELPPLPGQEASAVSGLHHDNDDMIWPSNSSLQHPTPFVVDDHDVPLSHDADLLLTDWSHFDFPTRP